ncbi:MAG: hypothetical protein C4306_12265 [Thermoleophilia bacterium]
MRPSVLATCAAAALAAGVAVADSIGTSAIKPVTATFPGTTVLGRKVRTCTTPAGPLTATALDLSESGTALRPTGQNPSRFGVSPSSDYDDPCYEHGFQLAAEARIGWVRAVLNWQLAEPTPGRHDWSTFDQLVGGARASGLRMVGGLGFATRWNTAAPPSKARRGRRLMYPPADLKAWKRYVSAIVRRCKDVVRPCEVWNEADLRAFWVDTPVQDAQLLAVTYDTIRRADPTATVVLGGLSLGGSPERLNPTFLQQTLADRAYPAARYFDVAAFHSYGSQREAQPRMEYVKSVLSRVGAARVFWFQLTDDPGQNAPAAAMGMLDSNVQPKTAYYAHEELIAGPPSPAAPARPAAAATVSRPAASATASRPTGRNPFGVMLPSRLVRSPQGMQVTKALGAVYFRPSAIFLDEWKGTCPECDIALKAGLKLVLTVRNNGRGQATSPPTNVAAYRRTLSKVLEKYRPAVLVVENEEDSALFYTGTPEEYAAELKAACQVAHQKGIPCTNGGLVSKLVALLVYDSYLASGQAAAAQDFAARVFTPREQRLLRSPKAMEQIRKGKALLQAYRAAGVNYVNFHWYIADTWALEKAVAFLRAETGRPVITNEIGQLTDDPRQTTAGMEKIVALGLPIAVWFGLDGPKARGLVNLDGSLRPTGQAFKRFVEDTFAASK